MLPFLASAGSLVQSGIGKALAGLADLGCAHDYGPGTAVYRGQRALDPTVDAGTRLWSARVVLYATTHYSALTRQTAAHVWSGLQAANPTLAAQATAQGGTPNDVATDPVPHDWIPQHVGPPPCEGSGALAPYQAAWQQFLATVQTQAGGDLARLGAGLGMQAGNAINPAGGYVNVPTSAGVIVAAVGGLVLLALLLRG